MSPRFMQAIILAVFLILFQTTTYIHCGGDSSAEDVDDSHVLALTNDTFDDAISNHKHILVKFVAPWCGHCKNLAPAYAKAAEELADSGSDIKLASVDATIDNDLAKKYNVQGYPTLLFFNNGASMEYNGGRSKDEIINWLKKRTGPPAASINTVEELKIFQDSDEVVVLGAFKDEKDIDAVVFLQIARSIDHIPFGITSDSAVFKELGITDDTIVLFKQFDEGRNDLTGPLEELKIRDFIELNELPYVVEFTPETAQRIFGGNNKLHTLLITDTTNSDFEKQAEEFEKVAKNFYGKLRFVVINAADKQNGRILEYFSVKPGETPTVRLVSFMGKVSKFKMDPTDITADAMIKFVNGYFDGTLKQFFNSQDIPADWDKKPLKILVGKNLREVAFDKTKTVLVSFVAPWCGHCKSFAPLYEELAEKYKDHDDVIIAKVDATLNEFENISIPSFPTIMLFPKGSDAMITYEGHRTIELLTKFVDSNGEDQTKPVPTGKEPEEIQIELGHEDEGEGDDDAAATAGGEEEADADDAAAADNEDEDHTEL